jgi:hypothetical protein
MLLLAGCGAGDMELFGGPGHSIVVEPLMPLVRPGNQVQFTVKRITKDGTVRIANPRDYEWSSSNPAVGTVDRDGLFTALAAGQSELACIERADKRVQAYSIATVDLSAP